MRVSNPSVARALTPWLVTLAMAGTSSGCFPTDSGLEPPLDGFNYPVGLALSPDGERLYVANSDYDLRFNSGVIQALDLAVVREHLPLVCTSDGDCPSGSSCGGSGAAASLCVDDSGSPCGSLKPSEPTARANHPGACQPLPLETSGLLLEAARIAPFVADIRYVPPAEDRPARVMMPVRGDATLHWADVEDPSTGQGPVLDCGQSNSNTECDADHRRGDESSETGQGELLPTEPFGIAVSADGDSVFLGHQSQGKVSVFANRGRGPTLQAVLEGLPSNPMGLATVPAPAAVARLGLPHTPGLLVSYRYSGQVEPRVELLRYFDAEAAEPAAPYLSRAGSVLITPNSSGLDSRGLAVDVAKRSACELECEADCAGEEPSAECESCLLGCAAVPTDVYLVNRSPHSLLFGQSQLATGELARDDLPNFSDTLALRGGPSRVVTARVTDARGQLVPRVFVLAFDARLLYVIDPESHVVETHLETGPGPQAFVVDEQRAIGYLAHFTDSYLSVVDLNQRHASYGKVLLNVGVPQPPRSSK